MPEIEKKFKSEIETESKKKKAKEIFDYFRKGKLEEQEKDLKNLGLDARSLENEINELIIDRVRKELKNINLEITAESKDFAEITKTSVYSHPRLDYAVKVMDDLSPYRLAERVNINGLGTGFIIIDNLGCKIEGKDTLLPEAVIQSKARPLKSRFEGLLKGGNLPEAKLLMEKFVGSVEAAWKRGFQFGMDHFTKDYGEEPSGIITCFDPVFDFNPMSKLEKPDIYRNRENIRRSLLELQGLSPEFVDWANKLVEKSLTPKLLNEIWKTEKGGKNVFIPHDEAVKNILNFLNSKLEKVEK